ncbi:MAG: magnesium transporter [Epsilonproteobacteria bacterium]|nr:MAG: magnesium transporter [Campylobacterota bacterium]
MGNNTIHLEEAKQLLDALLEKPEGFEEYHAIEIANILKEIYRKEGSETYLSYARMIPEEHLGEVLLELPEDIKDEALNELSVSKLVDIVDELDSDDAVDLMQDIEDIDIDKEREIFSGLDQDDIEDIKLLQKYEEDEAGGLMQTELFSAHLDEQIGEAVERLKKLKREEDLDNIHQVFIIDKFDILLGVIMLEDLITYDFDKNFRVYFDKTHKMIQTVKASDGSNRVANIFENYDLVVLPVVDNQGILVGRITSDDVYDVIEERATDQIYKMAGVDDETEEDKDIVSITKKRAIWLGVNLLTAILASLIIGIFDETIQKYVALAILMPIVASMGGNAGTQSLTIMVRQIALGEMSWQEAKSSIRQEMIVAFLNGLVFALLMGVIAYFWFHDARLGIVIAMAMVINLLAAGFFGAIIPLGLKKIGTDPAIASSVLLTTVTDVLGFFAFLGLAKIILT